MLISLEVALPSCGTLGVSLRSKMGQVLRFVSLTTTCAAVVSPGAATPLGLMPRIWISLVFGLERTEAACLNLTTIRSQSLRFPSQRTGHLSRQPALTLWPRCSVLLVGALPTHPNRFLYCSAKARLPCMRALHPGKRYCLEKLIQRFHALSQKIEQLSLSQLSGMIAYRE